MGKRRQETNRVHYIFALRQPLPLPDDGWHLEFRVPNNCRNGIQSDSGCACCAGQIHMWQFPTSKVDLSTATKCISAAIGELKTGVSRRKPRNEKNKETITVAMVGTYIDDSDDTATHYYKSFDLLRRIVMALRINTRSRVPNLSIEGVWPIYLRIPETKVGKYDVLQLILIEHGFAEDKIATEKQLLDSKVVSTLAMQDDPLVMYRDFELASYNAARIEGDYTQCILNCAITMELLIKHVSWMLIWEHARVDWTNEAYLPLIRSSDSYGAKPAILIGGILAKKLKGNWDSKRVESPVGGWRVNILEVRNRVIHGGYNPTEEDTQKALSALRNLHFHIFGRVIKNAKHYPLTAALLMGSPYSKSFAQRLELIQEYNQWLNWLFENRLKKPYIAGAAKPKGPRIRARQIQRAVRSVR